MLITIEKQDVEKAIAAYPTSFHKTDSCPVFQALRRAGVPVKKVGFTAVLAVLPGISLPKLPPIAESITYLEHWEWVSIETPVTFEYPYVKNTTP